MTSSREQGFEWLLSTRNAEKWKKIGVSKRAGVCVPLFSVYSGKSRGTGEFPDIRLLVDWCKSSGLSILQLLPLNDTGFDFSPYNAVSTFALDPVYLRIAGLKDADLKPHAKELRKLAVDFRAGKAAVDYGVKERKLKILRTVFDSGAAESERFESFKRDNMHWLKYYALFRTLSIVNGGKEWMHWDILNRYLSPANLMKISESRKGDLEFQYWVQWQAFEQLSDAKRYAEKMGVFIMGDLPFLVSRNSADVWAYKNYFKLGLSSGAPPDMYFAKGQKWGMPPYDWADISADNYNYIRARLRYAGNFYDMFRIDHFVGLFRVWTSPADDNDNEEETAGRFDPGDESTWDAHGREILDVICSASGMLPCAEDLGTVPSCSPKALIDYGITGMNVQRWEKITSGFSRFLPADDYRENSNAVVSTHDSSSFPDWLEREAGTVDRMALEGVLQKKHLSSDDISVVISRLFDVSDDAPERLRWKSGIVNVFMLLERSGLSYEKMQDIVGMYLSSYGEKEVFLNYIGHKSSTGKASSSLIRKNLKKIFSTSSVFSIQLLSEYLFLDSKFLSKNKYYRINTPGTTGNKNWSAVLPVSLEDIKKGKSAELIKALSKGSGRI